MIKTFRCRHTEALFLTGRSHRLAQEIQRSGARALQALDAARSLADLAGNGRSLEDYAGGRKAIRVNDRYRVLFRWEAGDAYDVEITDYH